LEKNSYFKDFGAILPITSSLHIRLRAVFYFSPTLYTRQLYTVHRSVTITT